LRRTRNSPSRQRRRARRYAASQQNKESENKCKSADAEKAVTVETIDAPVVQTGDDKHEQNEADKTFPKLNERILNDEVCNDQEYESCILKEEVKSICSIELYPEKYNLDGLEGFRAKVEEYFKKRTDIVNRVVKCEVENYGNNVKLVTEVKLKRGWSFFFNDPGENYGDLDGVRTVRHSCQDLSNCGG
jgi:hypothetical protein